MTNVAYKPLSAAERIFKDLIWTPGVLAGELAIEGAVPFFALPVIKNIEEGVVNALSDWFFNQFILLIDVTAIRLVNAAHQAAYDSASLQLKVIAYDNGIDSDEFKKARDAAKLALSKFTQFSH